MPMDRSALVAAGVTVVASVSELSERSGSDVDEATPAVLLRGPFAGAVAVIVMTGAVVTARLGRVQLMTPEDGGPQVHPLPEAATFVSPAGSWSATVSDVAGSGPAFVTVS